MYVILVYDIKSDQGGAKVLSKTFKTCKKYLIYLAERSIPYRIGQVKHQ